jgi:hypothetical protein
MPEPAAHTPASLALPEFTRSLRGFASVQALGNPDHDRVFAALLAARRTAARVESVEGRLAAFDGARLRRALDEAIAAISAERTARDGAERRALLALLTELAEPACAAAEQVARAAAAVRAARGDRDGPWAAWIAAVQDLFDRVDGFWMALQRSLGPPSLAGAGKRRKRRAEPLRALVAGLLGA